MSLSMEQVDLATLLYGSVRINDSGNINFTWRSPIKTHAGDTIAYVKWVRTSRELFVEVICAILGRSIGLPIPKPYLVMATPAVLEDAPWNGEITKVLLGSEDAGHPSFRRFLDPSLAVQAISNLKQWEKINLAGCFDEWIANPDRHASNILFDGDQSYWLIDHGLAIQPGLPVASAVRNILLNTLVEGIDEVGRARLKRLIKKEAELYSNIVWELVPAKARYQIYVSDNEVEEVINFLRQRVMYLAPLIAFRLGQQQIGAA